MVQPIDQEADLLARDHERRAHQDRIADGAVDDSSAWIHEQAGVARRPIDPRREPGFGREGVASTGLDELDPRHQALAPDVADDRVATEPLELAEERWFGLGDAVDHLLADHRVERRRSDRTGHRVATPRE